MNQALIDKIVHAVLYEGYILYPYRQSTKSRQRWTFGGVFPREFSGEPHVMASQFLLRGNEETAVTAQVRFLQLIDRTPMVDGQAVEEIQIGGKRYQKWQEAAERTINLEVELAAKNARVNFDFLANETTEKLGDRHQLKRTSENVRGTVEIQIENLRDDVHQLTLRITNSSPLFKENSTRDEAQMQSMASTHSVLSARGGNFISLIDPPADVADLVQQCKQIGAWPVHVGESGATDAMLASPIILYDYPQIAAESPGDLFDGTEIDEILSLRVMTLTDDEKKSAADLDEHAAELIGRTESLAREQLAKLHGTMRSPPKIQAVHVADAELRAGDRVILQPTGRADAFDIILRGKTATIIAIEQDYENRIHLAVTIDDDPGAYIGAAGQIGHRFFFRPEEVRPLRQEAGAQ